MPERSDLETVHISEHKMKKIRETATGSYLKDGATKCSHFFIKIPCIRCVLPCIRQKINLFKCISLFLWLILSTEQRLSKPLWPWKTSENILLEGDQKQWAPLFKDSIYLREKKRKRARTHAHMHVSRGRGRAGRRGRGTESQADSMLSAEPDVGLDAGPDLMTLRLAEPKPRVGGVTNWATQAPRKQCPLIRKKWHRAFSGHQPLC